MILITDAKNKILDVLPGTVAFRAGEDLAIDGRPYLAGFNFKERRFYSIPDQPLDHIKSEDGTYSGVYPDDVVTYSKEDVAMLYARAVDRETGKAIDEAIHPFAGIEEQIGILRAQIAEILVALGLESTDEFAKLNSIAAEKIQEGQKKKEALNDAKDS